MITQAIMDTLARVDNDGSWSEFSLNLDEDLNRRLRIAHSNGFLEVGDAVQGSRWRAYRLTPLGMATLDQHRIEKRRAR